MSLESGQSWFAEGSLSSFNVYRPCFVSPKVKEVPHNRCNLADTDALAPGLRGCTNGSTLMLRRRRWERGPLRAKGSST